MQVTRTSMMSNKQRTMELDITEKQLHAWQNEGVLIQDAFPNLTPAEREFLMTGMTDEEWNELFPSEEDDDD